MSGKAESSFLLGFSTLLASFINIKALGREWGFGRAGLSMRSYCICIWGWMNSHRMESLLRTDSLSEFSLKSAKSSRFSSNLSTFWEFLLISGLVERLPPDRKLWLIELCLCKGERWVILTVCSLWATFSEVRLVIYCSSNCIWFLWRLSSSFYFSTNF